MLRSRMRDANECEKKLTESEGENFDGGERKFEDSSLLHLGLSNPTSNVASSSQGEEGEGKEGRRYSNTFNW